MTRNLQTLPRSIPEVQTLTRMADAFPSQGSTATVVVHGAAADHSRVVGRSA